MYQPPSFPPGMALVAEEGTGRSCGDREGGDGGIGWPYSSLPSRDVIDDRRESADEPEEEDKRRASERDLAWMVPLLTGPSLGERVPTAVRSSSDE